MRTSAAERLPEARDTICSIGVNDVIRHRTALPANSLAPSGSDPTLGIATIRATNAVLEDTLDALIVFKCCDSSLFWGQIDKMKRALLDYSVLRIMHSKWYVCH